MNSSHSGYKLLNSAEEKGAEHHEAPWKVAITKLRDTLKKLEFIEYRYGEKTNGLKYGPNGKYDQKTKDTRQLIRDL